MKNIYLRQRIAAILPWAIAASLLMAPAATAVMLGIFGYAKKRPEVRVMYQVALFGLTMMVVAANGIMLHYLSVERLLALAPSTVIDWIFTPSLPALLIPSITMTALVTVGTTSADAVLLEGSKASRLPETTKVDNHNPSHIFVAGTTGSGKTTYLLNYILLTIQQSDEVYILSGKNGTNDSRSLLNITKRIAARYGRTMYTVSLNAEEESCQPYNPLDGMSPTEAADALVEISEYTEPHYKACTSAWIKAVCEGLCAAEIPLSIASICDFYDYFHGNADHRQLRKSL